MRRLLSALFYDKGPKYSWKKVFTIVAISSFIVSGSGIASYSIYRSIKRMQACDTKAHIQAIIQTGPAYAPFPNGYLAEALQLSADTPTHLELYDLQSAQERIFATGVIRTLELKKIKPNLLWIDYSPRAPLIFLGDVTNTVMDESGHFFPFAPFFSPRKLPSLYLGKLAPTPLWGAQLDQKYLEQILFIMSALDKENIESIDLSQIEASSSGKRELVVSLKNKVILRLTPTQKGKQLERYSQLRRVLEQKQIHPLVIDLRVSNIALIQEHH